MKKLTLIAMMALSASLFQACKGSKSGGSTDSSSTTKTDSTTTVKDTTKKDTSAMAALPDSVFAKKAAIGGMAEVALGKMAEAKSSDAKIKEFGQMMVKDHGKANDELAGIAKTEKLVMPATLDTEHQAKGDSLRKLSGKDFDKAYIDAMVDGHKKTLALMQGEAANGKDASLKAFAAKTAPIVQMHLDAINKLHDSMK